MKKSLLLLLFCHFGLQAQDFWTEVSPFSLNPNFEPRQISIVNDDVVWVSGFDQTGTSFKWSRSMDAGITWTEGDINLGSPDLIVSSIHAVSPTTAYVSSFPNAPAAAGGVWITQDSGITWTQQTSAAFGTNSFPNFIHFWDTNNGIVVGDPLNNFFEIYTTADSGITWTQVPSTNIPAISVGEYGYSLHYETRNNSIWFGTNKGRIFKSADLGLNWTVSQSPLTDFSSVTESGNLAFRNENEGLLVADDWTEYRTNDSGNTWVVQTPIGTMRNFNIVFVPQTNNAYFMWGESWFDIVRGASYSINGGYDWIDLDSADAQPVEPITAKFQSGIVGFCIGRYSFSGSSQLRFFRLTDPLFRLLENNDFRSGAQFSVYPNPTNGLVKISGENISAVVIYDISGKKVFSSAFQSLDSIEIDVSHLQNGIYLAKVTSQTGSSSTVKIVKS